MNGLRQFGLLMVGDCLACFQIFRTSFLPFPRLLTAGSHHNSLRPRGLRLFLALFPVLASDLHIDWGVSNMGEVAKSKEEVSTC